MEPLIFYKQDKGKLDLPFYYCLLDFAFAVSSLEISWNILLIVIVRE